MSDSETISINDKELYFFCSATIVLKRENKGEVYHIRKYKSISFVLEHYPSKQEIKDMFEYDNIVDIKILSFCQWTIDQYTAYNDL